MCVHSIVSLALIARDLIFTRRNDFSAVANDLCAVMPTACVATGNRTRTARSIDPRADPSERGSAPLA